MSAREDALEDAMLQAMEADCRRVDRSLREQLDRALETIARLRRKLAAAHVKASFARAETRQLRGESVNNKGVRYANPYRRSAGRVLHLPARRAS